MHGTEENPITSGPDQYTVLKGARLQVERKVNTWSLAVLSRTTALDAEPRLACQWFWQANSRFLFTDMTIGVTRAVVVTRHVPIEEIEGPKAGGFTVKNMSPYLQFDFQLRVCHMIFP